MCGIAGFIGAYSRELLEKMAQLINHRGPDDTGYFYDPQHSIGLAHKRLSILDLTAAGHQPMWNDAHTIAIVFNGEIYNYRELKSEMAARSITFNSTCDTEVLLKLYEIAGIEVLSRLNGIFAFAIWDSTKNELFCARDHFGVKPFYYYYQAQRFIFSSELKSILCESSVDRSLDFQAIGYYLDYLWAPSPHTMLKSVKKLEPGHALIIYGDGSLKKKWCYYDIPVTGGITQISRSQAFEKVEIYLRQAVDRQMVADVEVGAFLSGGLDSSTIAAFALQSSASKKLRCFTIRSKKNSLTEEGLVDDLPYAEAAAKHLGVELNIVDVDSNMAKDFLDTIYQMDEPQADPASINVRYISSLARKNGIKVLLSGAGGDDIFSGYRRHRALAYEKYWQWMPQFCKKGIRVVSSAIPNSKAMLRRLQKAFAYADLPLDERIASYFHWISPSQKKLLFAPHIFNEIDQSLFSRPLMETLNSTKGFMIHPLNKMLYLEMKYFLPDHNLNYTDKMSMAEGVEVRVPFLDRDLVEFSCTLPVHYKLHGTSVKWVLKKTMEKYLPREIIYRPKTGFGVPLRRWIREDLSEYVNEILSENSIRSRNIFDYTGVKKLIELDRKRIVEASYTVLSLMSIELWCRKFL